MDKTAAFFKAILENDLQSVKNILPEIKDLNIPNDSGLTGLLMAVKTENTDIVKILLENGADPDKADGSGITPLIKASELGNTEIIQMLLDGGAGKELIEHELGATAVFAAVIMGKLKAVEMLCARGVSVNSIDKNGFSPLFYAVAKKNVPIAEFLIGKGADPLIKNNFGENMLMKAADSGSLEMVRLLVERGIPLDDQSANDGFTALMLAADKGHAGVVKFLLEKGADKNIAGFALRKAADYARLKGYTEVENLLKDPRREVPAEKITRKQPINEKATKAMLAAIWDDDINAVTAALKDGADIKPPGDDIPVIIATMMGSADMVRFLINQGAEVDRADSVGITALVKAAGGCHVDIAGVLLENGASVTPDVVMAASIHRHPGIIELLNRYKTDTSSPDIRPGKEESAVVKMASEGNLEGIKKFLSGGGNVNAQDNEGGTALLWASRKGHGEICRFLLESGADPDIRTDYLWTALMEAALSNHAGIVKLLIDKGADVNAATKQGATALMMASSEGYADIVELLLGNKARKDMKVVSGDSAGLTAKDFAEKKGHNGIVSLLEE